MSQRLPTLRFFPEQLTPKVLVVGDPARAFKASQLLESPEELGSFREFRSFRGCWQGEAVTIVSHGVGGAGANMCFHELMQAGAKLILRAGTCGATLPDIEDGQMVIASGAIREDGVTDHMAPPSFPAIADRFLVAALEEASLMRKKRYHIGLVLTQAYFYPGILQSELDVWMPQGLIAGVEMELSVLLVMAGLKKVRAGGIFTSDGNLTRTPDPEAYDPHRRPVSEGVETMLRIGLDALVNTAL